MGRYIHSISGLAAGFITLASVAQAEMTTITDITGREVQVDVPVERVILGEGRQIFFASVLDTEDPFGRVVGWRDDFMKADLDGYNAYREVYPDIDDIPTFGGMKDGSFDIEQAVTLSPDVIIMNLESKAAIEEGDYPEKLAAVGIPLVYVDFRERPIEHTAASMDIIGTMFGKLDRAEEFNEFYNEQMARVTDVITAKSALERPLVFVERAGGYSEDCCMSFGNENFGLMVEIAGGSNMASPFIPGTFGTVNAEQIVASNPDQVVVTGANWEMYVPGGNWVGVGSGADLTEARAKLANLMERPAFTGSKAKENNEVHAIWHQFYNNPYQFVAVQQMAKWFHPDLFADLDPDATFKELHERFLPVEYRPGYFATLSN